jgi:hypothetical protein
MLFKIDVMHMFMKTRCTCSCSMVLMMHVITTRLPTKWVSDWDDKPRLRRGCAWRVAILTTKIPSALLVAIMWLQRTWRPRFRHGTFSYGITMSPTQERQVWVGKFPCECTLVHPRLPNAHAMQLHAQEGTCLFIYLFFKRLWARPWGISSWLKVRRNHDKDINIKNILVLQHV